MVLEQFVERARFLGIALGVAEMPGAGLIAQPLGTSSLSS